MNELFAKEEQLAADAEELLCSHAFANDTDETHYRTLFDGYRRLLTQMMRVVKMSDLMQLELRNLSERLGRISQLDPLTGIYNMRFFNDALQREWQEALESGSPLALLMIDIDHFKRYNDTYGHMQGDECLKKVAGKLQQFAGRPRDVLARFGGEEFIVLLPQTNLSGAVHVAAAMLAGVRNLGLAHLGAETSGQVTVSIGVAVAKVVGQEKSDALLRRVDDALYAAKAAGRDCLRIGE